MGWTSQYVLENESGERYDLTAPAPVYLVNVQGLGAAERSTFASLNGGHWLMTDTDAQQQNIIGDLIYLDGAFANYTLLVNWIMRAKALFFCYAPESAEYRCKVRLQSISKDKRNSAGVMRASITFAPLTPWYTPTPTEIDVPRAGADSKGYEYNAELGIYCYTYDDDLHYGPELGGDIAAQIIPSGHVPAAFLLRYTGAAVNPVIIMTGLTSGTEYGRCEINDTLSGADVLLLCTAPDDSYVRKVSSGVETDLMAAGKVNLAYEPYPRAPIDEPCSITIEDSTERALTGKADLTVYQYYRSV